MFFQRFEKVSYDPEGLGMGKDSVNILNSLLVKYHPATNTTQYFYHTLKEGETPEILAKKYYGNPYYHWIIILMNGVVDPYFDWSLDSDKFRSMLTMRYGAGNENELNHLIYLDTNKRLDEVAQQDAVEYFGNNGAYPVNVSPVSNSQFEMSRNDENREIKILQSRYVQQFVNQLEDLMNRDLLV